MAMLSPLLNPDLFLARPRHPESSSVAELRLPAHAAGICDGLRPKCLSCVQLQLPCEYQQPPQQSDGHQRLQSKSQLLAKVKELESRLSSGHPASPSDPSPGQLSASDSNADEFCVQLNSMTDSHDNASSPSRITDGSDQDQETGVDVLATVTFNQGSRSNIGHFGPSSNHALFRAISDAFARIVSVASSERQIVRSRGPRPSYQRPQERTSQESAGQTNPRDIAILTLPLESQASVLIDRFFVSAGAFLPFVNYSALVSDCKRLRGGKALPHLNSRRALLNAVFALASASIGGEDSDVFICRAIASLNERELRGASVELVQALLLIATYQQNHQLSITSWTYHALAVKAAFQLGLHSPLGYREYGLHECETRKRLWYSLINQDRVLSLSLGRPCLISKHYIRTQKPLDPRTIHQSMPAVAPNYINSVIYHIHQISLNDIVESMLHGLYNDNIESDEPSRLQDVIAKRLPLQWQLETWRQQLDPSCQVLEMFEFDRGLSSFPPDSIRFQLVLSASYYRIMMLIDTPVLIQVLSETVNTQRLKKDSDLLTEHIVPIIRHDYKVARELHRVIQTMSTYDERFLDQTAAWWMCSYTLLTVNMNFFCIILLSQLYDEIMPLAGISVADVRQSLNEGIASMEVIQRTSLMAVKARRCLVEFLEVFDSIVPQQQVTPVGLANQIALEDLLVPTQPTFRFETNNNSQRVSQAANDFLWQYSQSNFLGDNNLAFFPSDDLT